MIAPASEVPDRGRVLRLSLVGWGLGHLALGRHATGGALLVGEVAAAGILLALSLSLVDTTLQLVPFLAGVAFVVLWAAQAIAAYRLAAAAGTPLGADRSVAAPPGADRSAAGAGPLVDRSAAGAPPGADRSAAASIAWLSLPLLVWSSGFWLLPSSATAPGAALDRFVSDWTDDDLAADGWPGTIARAAADGSERLQDLCDSGVLRTGCEAGGSELFRDVRIRIIGVDDTSAVAVAEAVRYVRRDTTFLWVFPGTELVPTAIDRVLELRLAADPAAGRLLGLGAREWHVASADTD